MSYYGKPPPLIYSVRIDDSFNHPNDRQHVADYISAKVSSDGYRIVRHKRTYKDYSTFSDIYEFEVEAMSTNVAPNKQATMKSLMDLIQSPITTSKITNVDSKPVKKPKKKTLKAKPTPVTSIEVNFDMITYDDPSFYIPEEWTMLLSYTSGYIAGGSIRDLELGATVKDVDVFLHVDDKKHFTEKVQDIIKALKVDDKNVIRFDGDYQDPKTGENVDGLDNEVGLVVKIKTDNFAYDIIGRKGIDSLDKVVAQFDLGICQIGYDGKTVQCSENYIRDKACKTITILKPMKFGTNGWAHMVRVAEKYKNYKLV